MEIEQHILNDQWIIEEIRKGSKKFLDSNENESTTYWNLWDTAKKVLSGKFIAMNSHIRKLERS
jgi:hypothetical protein